MFKDLFVASLRSAYQRLFHVFLLFVLFSPFLILRFVDQKTPEESHSSPAAMIVFYGYCFFAIFIWPIVFGGVIGEMASILPERFKWETFKEKAIKKYDRILLFSLFLSVVVILLVIGLRQLLLSPMMISSVKAAAEGESNFWKSQFSDFIVEITWAAAFQLFILMSLACVTAITIAEKGFWRHLKMGALSFLKKSTLGLYLVFVVTFLSLNLLNNLLYDESVPPSYFFNLLSILVPIVRSFLWIVAIAFFLFLLKPQYEIKAGT